MINLNEANGADKILLDYTQRLLTEFRAPLIGCEMGIAYGGGVEAIGKLWKDRGIIYGFDTFEDLHPVHLAGDKSDFEARCMDHWYTDTVNGTARLSYDYQRSQLDGQGLNNVVLVKGEVHNGSCKGIPYLNYCLLDMDIIASMRNGYGAVKDKFLPGSYLFIHDALPETHLPKIYKWVYSEVLSAKWQIEGEWPDNHLLGLRRV